MKKLLILLPFTFLTTTTWGQTQYEQDTIITIKYDTVICKILSVSDKSRGYINMILQDERSAKIKLSDVLYFLWNNNKEERQVFSRPQDIQNTFNDIDKEIKNEISFDLQIERINKIELSLGNFYKQRRTGIYTILTGIGVQTLATSLLRYIINNPRDFNQNQDLTPIYVLLVGGGVTTLVGGIIYIDSNKHLKKYRNTVY